MRMRIAILRLAIAGGMFALAPSAHALLVGVSSATNSYYTVNPATGAATFISPVLGGTASFSGMSFLGGIPYASDILREAGFRTVEADLSSGASTDISNQDGSSNWHGLASNESAGVLYSIDLDDSNILKSLAPDGTVTSIGTGTGIDGRGMAYDDGSGILYATGPVAGAVGQSLFRVDTGLGTSTVIGATGIDSFYIGLAFDEIAGILYMVADPSGSAADLYALNTATGAATLIGSTGVEALDGLAWIDDTQRIPEPATLALLGLAIAGLGFSRRRKLH